MLKNPSNPHIQLACVQLLTNLAHLPPPAPQQIAHAKGIQLLVHTMLVHKESLQISIHAARALAAILDADPSIASVFFQFFGVEVVVGASKNFLEDVCLQRVSLKLLLCIAQNDHASDQTAHARRGAQARAALRVLKRYKKEDDLALDACRLLKIVAAAADVATIEQLGRIGAVRVLGVSIIGFKEAEALQECAYTALSNFVTVDEECAWQLAAMRGAEIVVRALRRFRRCVALNVSCVALLHALVDLNDVQTNAVFTAGGLETMLSLMIEYREVAEIQTHAIAVVDRLAWLREDIRHKILSIGGAQTLSTMLSAHLMNEEIVEAGARTLRYIRQGK